MAKFTNAFVGDCLSQLEIEGFWILASNQPVVANLNTTLRGSGMSGWDNRNDLLPTNSIYKNGKLEISFYPSDLYSAGVTSAQVAAIKSWYLMYRLPVLFQGVGDYRFAAAFSVNDYPIKDVLDIQTVLTGTVSTYANITTTLIEESGVPYNILRAKYLAKDSDTSIADDKALIHQFNSSLITNGLFNGNKCVIIK